MIRQLLSASGMIPWSQPTACPVDRPPERGSHECLHSVDRSRNPNYLNGKARQAAGTGEKPPHQRGGSEGTFKDTTYFLQGRPMGLPEHTAASLAAEEKVKMATHKDTTYTTYINLDLQPICKRNLL